MNLILGLDTSTRQGALALFDRRSGESWIDAQVVTGNHGRELIPAIGRLFESAGRRIEELGGIAVGVGPGSYTGLRVGVAVAKTVAEVLQVPAVEIDSLILPVIELPERPESFCVCIADAQRGAVAEAVYEKAGPNGLWRRLSGPEIRPWGDLSRWRDHASPLILTGPGLELSTRLGASGLTEAPPEFRFPTSAALLTWIRARYDEATPIAVDALEPVYLRPSAAEEKRQATISGAGTPESR